MSKNISVSDDVYDALKRRKRDRSFSETIEEAIEQSGGLSDVVGQGAFSEVDLAETKADLENLTQGTLRRLGEEPPDEAS